VNPTIVRAPIKRRSPVAAMDRELEELAMIGEATGSPPTSSWGALETPVTLARRGHARGQAGGAVEAATARSGRRSGVVAATTSVLLNTARSDGKEFQKRGRSC
jgi:hypothetical protein